ncbi:LOW QUALITY PROTEIN: RING finger protein 32 [Ammospiza maritima maritima]
MIRRLEHLCYGDRLGVRAVRPGEGKAPGCFSKQETRAVSAVALQDHIIQNHQLQDPLTPKSRTRNTNNFYKSLIKEIVSIIANTGLRKKSTSKEDAKKENLVDPSAPQLTLVCFICTNEMKYIASNCNYNYFLKNLQVKSCPMCRKEQYLTGVIHDELSYRIASWRGYIARKESKDLREAVPPKDRKLRKQLFEKMLCLQNPSLEQRKRIQRGLKNAEYEGD